MEPSERLQEILKKNNWSFSKFAELTGLDSLKGQRDKYVGKAKDGKNKSIIKMEKKTNFEKIGINYNWYLTGVGEMSLTSQVEDGVGVPYYSIDVTASIKTSFNDIVEHPEYFINFKPFNDCTAYLMVFGDSMYPMFSSGDIIAVKHIINKEIILWGEPHLVITNAEANDMRTVKLVFQHSDPAKIILRASNPNYSGDTVISKDDIINIFIVKGKITRRQS